MSSRKYIGSALAIGGGATVVGASIFAYKKSQDTTQAIVKAVSAPPVALPLSEAVVAKLPVIKVRLTGYWPFYAAQGGTHKEKLMEGGIKDRHRRPLYTLEMHQKDPVKYPYVSVSGDHTIWPDGQRLILSPWPDLIFRRVDTGQHFYGAGKVYRIIGYEPLDICVDSPATVVPKTGTATIVSGDFWRTKGDPLDVITSGFKGQTPTFVGLEGRTVGDHEAMARALASGGLDGFSAEEQIAAAWAIRNRADHFQVAIEQLLAPHGKWGAVEDSGGYVATNAPPTKDTRDLTEVVLALPAASDPTNGAIDFWIPSVQRHAYILGKAYKAARANNDEERALRYARYADAESEETIRNRYNANGMSITNIIGGVELLGRRPS